MTPIIGHPEFTPGLTDPIFLSQSPQGLLQPFLFLKPPDCVKNIFTSRTPLAMDQWRAIQLSYFIGSLPKPALFSRKLHSFEELCLGEGPIHRSLSTSYKTVLDLHAVMDQPFLAKWERDLRVYSLPSVVSIKKPPTNLSHAGTRLHRFWQSYSLTNPTSVGTVKNSRALSLPTTFSFLSFLVSLSVIVTLWKRVCADPSWMPRSRFSLMY